MRVGISWRHRPPSEVEPPHLFEVVTPRTNTATLSSAENLFASIALDEPCSFEIAADRAQRRFLIRALGTPMGRQLLSQTAAAYPQADLRAVAAHDDPARVRLDEQLQACTLRLRAPAYLPLRTFSDLDLDGERAAQADPLLGILSSLGDLPAGWRGLSQLVVQAARDDWCRAYQRRAVQHPLEHERVQRPIAAGLPMLAFFAVSLGLVAVGLQAYVWFREEQWPPLLGLFLCSALVLLLAVAGIRRLCQPAVYDMELVREKVTRVAYRAELRLIVFAPAEASPAAVRIQLERIATAYRRYNLAAANGLVPRRLNIAPHCPPLAAPVGSREHLPILTTLELAGLWHLPHAAADVALLERTTARRVLPLPAVVAEGCRIGVSRHQGYAVPVSLPLDVLRRHMLLVAKTRRGKSTLMQRLALFAMQTEPRRAVLLVDPHRDLAEATLCQVPAERRADVVSLDVADRARPFGLNLLDTCLGWDRDRAVANALAVFQREWGDRYWGPRMEDAFRFALLSLFEANVALCTADPARGRCAQYTLLEVPTILSEPGFRRQVLSSVADPTVRAWWSDYFEPLDRRFQLELINPVLTKIHRFEGNTASRHIVGQPASTIDPGGWLRDGNVVIVNTARGVVGDNAAALIGSTLLNLVTLGVAEQARLASAARRPITIVVDEFHTIPGADYEAILAELSKYGANLVLATQSLSRLLALGRDDGRGLRATVFANLDALCAFNCSAEDAEYLIPELGGALDAQDLVELGEHQCYVRLSSGGRRLPTFSVSLDPPQSGEAGLGETLKDASAQRFGRAAELVEADRRSAVARVLSARALKPAEPPKRNEHRPRKKRRAEAVASNA
jgi:Helicase HerA, central domain